MAFQAMTKKNLNPKNAFEKLVLVKTGIRKFVQ